jgi:hypothetical protein
MAALPHLNPKTISKKAVPVQSQVNVLVFRQEVGREIPQLRRIAVTLREACCIQIPMQVAWHVLAR